MTDALRAAAEHAVKSLAHAAEHTQSPYARGDYARSLVALTSALAAPVAPAVPDPCPACRPGTVCRTPKCGRLKWAAAPQPTPAADAAAVPSAEPLCLLNVAPSTGKWVESNAGTAVYLAPQPAAVDGRKYTQADLWEAVKTERHACSIAVWMTLQDALDPGADDKGLDGWLREAEARVKGRLAGRPEHPAPAKRSPMTAQEIEDHIGPDEGDREAVEALVREVEAWHGITGAAREPKA